MSFFHKCIMSMCICLRITIMVSGDCHYLYCSLRVHEWIHFYGLFCTSFLMAFFLKSYPKYLVLEYGIDQIGEMDFLLSIAEPDVAVLLNISKNHIVNFGSWRLMLMKKQKLFPDRALLCILMMMRLWRVLFRRWLCYQEYSFYLIWYTKRRDRYCRWRYQEFTRGYFFWYYLSKWGNTFWHSTGW